MVYQYSSILLWWLSKFGVASPLRHFFALSRGTHHVVNLDNPPCPDYVGIMIDPKIIDDLSRRVADSLPGGLAALQDDVRRNATAAVQGALGRLDLVTREEFDIQQAVLARTREKLERLEARVKVLETRFARTDAD